MGELTRTRTTAQWTALLGDKAVPCSPIHDIGEAFGDDQVKARGLAVNQPLALAVVDKFAIKLISTVASPLRLTATPPVLRRASPALGEHIEEVLAGLGLNAPQMAALRQAGVV